MRLALQVQSGESGVELRLVVLGLLAQRFPQSDELLHSTRETPRSPCFILYTLYFMLAVIQPLVDD